MKAERLVMILATVGVLLASSPAPRAAARMPAADAPAMTYDEALFSTALLHDTSVDEICAVGERGYIIPMKYLGEVRYWVEHGLFDAVLAPLPLGWLELRDASLLRAFGASLAADPSLFGGNPPYLATV